MDWTLFAFADVLLTIALAVGIEHKRTTYISIYIYTSQFQIGLGRQCAVSVSQGIVINL